MIINRQKNFTRLKRQLKSIQRSAELLNNSSTISKELIDSGWVTGERDLNKLQDRMRKDFERKQKKISDGFSKKSPDLIKEKSNGNDELVNNFLTAHNNYRGRAIRNFEDFDKNILSTDKHLDGVVEDIQRNISEQYKNNVKPHPNYNIVGNEVEKLQKALKSARGKERKGIEAALDFYRHKGSLENLRVKTPSEVEKEILKSMGVATDEAALPITGTIYLGKNAGKGGTAHEFFHMKDYIEGNLSDEVVRDSKNGGRINAEFSASSGLPNYLKDKGSPESVINKARAYRGAQVGDGYITAGLGIGKKQLKKTKLYPTIIKDLKYKKSFDK